MSTYKDYKNPHVEHMRWARESADAHMYSVSALRTMIENTLEATQDRRFIRGHVSRESLRGWLVQLKPYPPDYHMTGEHLPDIDTRFDETFAYQILHVCAPRKKMGKASRN